MGVLLIAVKLKDDKGFSYSLKELEALAEACSFEVEDTITQTLDQINNKYYFNIGKLDEVKETIAEKKIEAVIANDELSGLQLKNLGNILDCRILDRTRLILEIFASRAQTREAKLQVDIAYKNYQLTHLVGQRSALYSQQGGSGFRGGGETQLQLDRRILRRSINSLDKELKQMVLQRQTQRKRRAHNNIKQVALVGYTNSGKSTLLNTLIGSNPKKAEVKDMLFATLQTSSRQVFDFPFNYLLSDTVGFIEKLPTALVKAFRSTLEEIKEADLLLLVIDLGNPEYDKQIATTKEVLKELDCGELPLIHVYNKADLIEDDYYHPLLDDNLVISCRDNLNIDELRLRIREQLFNIRKVKLRLPFERYELVNKIATEEELVELKENDTDIEVIAYIQNTNMENYREYLI